MWTLGPLCGRRAAQGHLAAYATNVASARSGNIAACFACVPFASSARILAGGPVCVLSWAAYGYLRADSVQVESDLPCCWCRRYATALAATAAIALVGVIAVTMTAERTQVEPVGLASVTRPAQTQLWGDMPDPKAVPKWNPGVSGIAPAGAAKALPIDYRSMFMSDMFATMSGTCCRTIFFPPGHGPRLPLDFPLDGPIAKRIRNFVANRNSLLFVGADSHTIQFMNTYFAYEIKQVPVISGFKRRESLMVLGDPSTASAIPTAYASERIVGSTYYGGLPDKIAPTEDMVSVDTLTLPGASIIIYNNWPRVPTGTPAFITRYCQIEDPYTEGGQPMKVEVLDCPAAEGRGFPCSCGFVHFVGWDWKGSNNNMWDSSVLNGDDLSLFFSLGDSGTPTGATKSKTQNLVAERLGSQQVMEHEDCSGPNCHF